ncbi:hypothetical protein [Pseudomonas sp. TH41]|uniref:hypothetical protein n=1 Tax=Pseudomonas sp. TH41 TaxID=2796405 RepID=UPI001F5BDDA5|nr:hypothetical protein [Pseudomonas sp. TH41]
MDECRKKKRQCRSPLFVVTGGRRKSPFSVLTEADALRVLENLKSQQAVALTRVRVELRDVGRVDRQALVLAGVPGVMSREGGVVHLITGL